MIGNEKLFGRTAKSILAALALLGSAELAQAQEFTHKADGQFELHLPADGRAAWTFNGSLREGEKAQARSGNTTVDLHSYQGDGLFVVATEEGREVSRLFLFVRQNANYVALNETPILGRSATLVTDVEMAVETLGKLNKWDVVTTFRAISAYFTINSTKQMTDFMDEVELGNMRSIPRAKPTVEESEDTGAQDGDSGEASNEESSKSNDQSSEPSEDQDPRYRHMQQPPQNPYGGRPPGSGYPPAGPYGAPGPQPQYYYRQNPGMPPGGMPPQAMQQPRPQRQQRAPRQQRQAPQQQQQNDSIFSFPFENPFF